MRSRSFSMLMIAAVLAGYGTSFAQEAKNTTEKAQEAVQDTVKIKSLTKGGQISPMAVVPQGSPKKIGTSAQNIGVPEDRTIVYFVDKKDSKAEIMYSDAPMYVDSNNGKASMFIQGTVKVDDAAEVVQVGETSLTGDIVSLKDATNTPKSLFVQDNTLAPGSDAGIISFVGKWNKQSIVREKANPLDNYDRPDNDDKLKRGMLLNFPVIKVRKEGIKLNGNTLQDAVDAITATPAAGDLINVANVPAYDFSAMGFVAAAPNVAISVNKLDINEGNRFNAEIISEGLYTDNTGAAIADAAQFYRLNSAYVDIKNLDDADSGHSEVSMRLYNYESDDATGEAEHADLYDDTEIDRTNTYKVNIKNASNPDVDVNNTDTYRAAFLRSFTSPFESHMRADYMLYHVLTIPGSQGVTGELNHPVGPPTTKIEAGKGYFFAMDASDEKFANITQNWHTGVPNKHADPEQLRERGGYFFSRVLRQINYQTDFYSEKYTWRNNNAGYDNYNFFSSVDANYKDLANNAAYERQRFVTGDVTVNVSDVGYLTYLANPYMTPISMRDMLGVNNSGVIDPTPTDTPFTVSNTGAYAVHDYNLANINAIPGLVLRARYWTVNTGLVATVGSKTLPDNYYAYNVKYDNVDITSSPATIPDPDKLALEPMQVFAVQAAKAGSFKFTNNLKIYSDENKATEFKRFPTSLAEHVNDLKSTTKASSSAAIPDWFVMEAVVQNKDGKIEAISADRTAVRFFDTATEGLENTHDVEKKLQPAATKTKSGDEPSSTVYAPSNVLYTTTPLGEALLANGVNYKIKEIPLHYLPGAETQDVLLTFHGLDGFEKISNVWLVDNFTGFEDKLYDGYEYTFQSQPSESSIGSKNRFTLVFDRDGEGPTLTENPITCYYSGSILHIGGLNEKDLGSKVYIYDLQGRLMGSTVINNYPGMEYQKALGQGTFIVKIVGNRNFDTKFVNLQNY